MIYHHKNHQPTPIGGDGDGSTVSTPWYWYNKTDGKLVTVNNSSSTQDHKRVYLRVKLLAGVQYTIGQKFVNEGDGMIWLYNQNGNQLIYNDDGGYEDDYSVDGYYMSDGFRYTPSTTGIYIIGAGAYSSATGDIKVGVNPAPESDPLPFLGLAYQRNEGFNQFGKPIKYRSASLANCSVQKSE